MLDAIVISDLHLGAIMCQTERLRHFLESLPDTRQLILNGDILEGSEHRLCKPHWKILSLLRKLSDEVAITWVRGNHDGEASAVAHLIGADFVLEYAFVTSSGRKVLCIHGDVWDGFLSTHPLLTWAADTVYLWLQRLSLRLAMRVKRNSKTFLRCADRVREGALALCRKRRFDVICCGHTHHAQSWANGQSYYNSGCWTDMDCHYLTVQGDTVKLEVYKEDVL